MFEDVIPAPLRSTNILLLIVGMLVLQGYFFTTFEDTTANPKQVNSIEVPGYSANKFTDDHDDVRPAISSSPKILTTVATTPTITTPTVAATTIASTTVTTKARSKTEEEATLQQCIDSPTAPRPSVMLGPKFMGRLGNNMFQLVSTVAIARSLNTPFCLNWLNTRLRGVMPEPKNINLNEQGEWACDNRGKLNGKATEWSVASEPGFAVYHDPVKAFHERFTQASVENRTIVCKSPEFGMRWWSGVGADTYFQSWRYFTPELVKELSEPFNSSLVSESDAIVDNIRKQLGGPPTRPLISIHIRLGDIGGINRNHLNSDGCQFYKGRWVKPAWIPPDAKYYNMAMDWMRKKYPNAIFMVVPQNYTAVVLENTFVADDTVVVNTTDHSEGLDIVLISRGEHAILSMGTYSWWGGYLTGGTVLYYPHQMNTKHWMFSTGFNISDFFPNWWIPIDPEPEKKFCEK